MIADLLDPSQKAAPGQAERFGCPTREEAVKLLAWIHYQSANPMVDRLVSDLMHEQKQSHWETTQGSAWALLALTEYARRVEGIPQRMEGQLRFGGQLIPFRVDGGTNVFITSFAFTNLQDATLTLLTASTNPLYAAASIEARPPETPQPRQDRGFSLERSYRRLDDENHPQDLTGLHVGDRVLVTLRLSVSETARFVAIDDPLPAVLEAVNAEFKTQEARAPGQPAEIGDWWESDYHEIRKDRCLWFADQVEPGNYLLRYIARVRAAGTATAASAKVEEMYHPERCGLSGSQVLVSQPLK